MAGIPDMVELSPQLVRSAKRFAAAPSSCKEPRNQRIWLELPIHFFPASIVLGFPAWHLHLSGVPILEALNFYAYEVVDVCFAGSDGLGTGGAL
jgi:hypothetical protein